MLRKVLAINAARKTNNTASLLKKALEGAESVGAKTELIHLHDYEFLGCRGCMSCKKLKNCPPKVCLQKDSLTPILEKVVYDCDAFIVGGPIYMWQPGGIFRSFSERLLYPYFIYRANPGVNYYPRKNGEQKCGLIFTMGAPKEMIDDFTRNKHGDSMQVWQNMYGAIIGNVDALRIYMTYHVKNFEGYELDCLNEPARKEYHEKNWGNDLQAAFEMGKKLGLK